MMAQHEERPKVPTAIPDMGLWFNPQAGDSEPNVDLQCRWALADRSAVMASDDHGRKQGLLRHHGSSTNIRLSDYNDPNLDLRGRFQTHACYLKTTKHCSVQDKVQTKIGPMRLWPDAALVTGLTYYINCAYAFSRKRLSTGNDVLTGSTGYNQLYRWIRQRTVGNYWYLSLTCHACAS